MSEFSYRNIGDGIIKAFYVVVERNGEKKKY
jgi:hypothetical protein